MHLVLFVLIGIFGLASYVIGARQIIIGVYAPSLFSRIVWLLLALNSFAGVIVSHSSSASILLGSILLIGNTAICILSFWKGTRTFGRLEYICIVLLALSALIWILFSAPLLNLIIGLVAHFIGALPTYRKVWINPQSESAPFWSLFFIASALSIVDSLGSSVKDIILPIYFSFFDGSMFLLSLRRSKNTQQTGSHLVRDVEYL